MNRSALPAPFAALPKAELHLHLEGSIQPETVAALARRHGSALSEAEVRARYSYTDFTGFLEAFKWVTSYLREPADYAVILQDLAEYLLSQNVVYAEITLSTGVMLLRGQSPEANFPAILRAAEPFAARGLQLGFVFDAVRHFGVDAAMRVVEAAEQSRCPELVAFGIGGDEMQVGTTELRPVYERAAKAGLHRLIHAGEVGGAEKIREAVELLGAERIGHGIAAIHDPALMDLLAQRRVALEVCPASNVCTGALARQLRNPGAQIPDHPLPRLLRHGIPIALSTDDPAMFHTTLGEEYEAACTMGLTPKELECLRLMSFEYAFLPAARKQELLAAARTAS